MKKYLLLLSLLALPLQATAAVLGVLDFVAVWMVVRAVERMVGGGQHRCQECCACCRKACDRQIVPKQRRVKLRFEERRRLEQDEEGQG